MMVTSSSYNIVKQTTIAVSSLALLIIFLALVILITDNVSATGTADNKILNLDAPPGIVDETQTISVQISVYDDNSSSLIIRITSNEETIEETEIILNTTGDVSQDILYHWKPSLPGDYLVETLLSSINDSNLSNNYMNTTALIRDLVMKDPDNYSTWKPYSYDFDPENGGWLPVRESAIVGSEAWRNYKYRNDEDYYGKNVDEGLVSPPINLSVLKSAEIWFYQKTLLGSGDVGILQVTNEPKQSVYNTNWYTLYTTSSKKNGDWVLYRQDLTAWVGQTIRLQFRFISDDDDEASGWWLDGFKIVGIYIRHNISIEIVDGPEHVFPDTQYLSSIKLHNGGIVDEDVLNNLSLEVSVLHQQKEMGEISPISITLKGNKYLSSLTSTEVLFNLNMPSNPGFYIMSVKALVENEEKPNDNVFLWPFTVGKRLISLDNESWKRGNSGEAITPLETVQPPYQLVSKMLINSNSKLGINWIQYSNSTPHPWISKGAAKYFLSYTIYPIYYTSTMDSWYRVEVELPSELTRIGGFQLGVSWNTRVTIKNSEVVQLGVAGPTVTIPENNLELYPGIPLDIEIEITNQGLLENEIQLSIDGLPTNWLFSWSQKLVILDAFSSKNIILTIEIPLTIADLPIGKIFETRVIANSVSTIVIYEQTLILSIPNPQIFITEWNSNRHSVLEGQEVQLNVQLFNNQSIVTFLNITLLALTEEGILPIKWHLLPSLDKNESKYLYFIVKPDWVGTHSYQLIIKSETINQEITSSILTIRTVSNPPSETQNTVTNNENQIERNALIAGVSIISILGLILTGIKSETIRYSLIKGLIPIWIPLYTRLRHDEMLDNQIRDNVYQYISTNPGSNYSTIMKELDLKNGLFAYHLTTLERENYIISRNEGVYKRFYPKNRMQKQQKNLLISRIDSEIKWNIVKVVQDNPGITQSLVARKMNVSRQKINYHVSRLVEDRVLNIRRNGRSTLLHLNPVFSKVLEH